MVLHEQRENKVMARQNVYLKQKTIDGIRQIVDMRREEGATASDANISSVCSEMLELGMRVYLNAKKRAVNDDERPEDKLMKELAKEVVKSRLASQEILKLMFDLQDIKSDSRNNYDKLVDRLKNQTDIRIESVFNGS
ncbi:relaxosome protein TraM [Pantoea sp. BAV 3049]|uniref:relaxosome protein TraM n=1 Tax=Pantoea sp. BAV 3049 TaxID=2654188 RepID=UPI001E4C93D0|nr:relaxosome protein TraM [Pantoea sp. BAV 3049]